MYCVFKDMYGNYLYDSIVNDTAIISEQLYNYLENKKICKKNICVQEEYEKLKEEGFFSEEKHSISYPILDYLDSLVSRMLSKITIQVTQACNFRCKYCAFTENDGSGRLHSNKQIEWDMMKKILDFFYEHSIDSEHVTIGFYGGEPFINFSIVKKAIEYVESIFEGKPILFAITTNATLLTSEILEFLEKRDVALTISLDGPKKLNDRNRVFAKGVESTFDIVKEKILLIVKNYRGLLKYLSINMVLDPSKPYSDYLKIYDEIPRLDEIRVQASVVSDDGLKEEHITNDVFTEEVEYAKFIDRITNNESCSCNRAINEHNVMSLTFKQTVRQIKRMVGRNIHSPAPAGPCIPAYNKLFVDVNGRFFPCEKVSEKISDLCIGNVETGIDATSLTRLIKIASLTKKECENCWCFNMCSSCAKYCVNDSGISREAKLEFCKKVKLFCLDTLYDYVSLKRHHELEKD